MADNGFVNLSDPSVSLDLGSGGSGEKKKVVTFKGEAGKTARIYFPSLDVCERRRHWSPGVTQPDGTVMNRGYYRCTQDTLGYCPVCAKSATDKSVKRSSQTFGANIVVYETDAQGNLTNPLNAHVAFWAFGAQKFDNLRQLIKEWGPLTEYDLIVSCTDTQFQKMMIQPARQCMVKENPELGARVQAMLAADSVPLDKFLCRDVSVTELAGVFGIPVSEIPPQFLNQNPNQSVPAANQSVSQPQTAGYAPGAVQNDMQSAPFNTAGAVPAQSAAPNQPADTSNYADISELTALLG